MTGAATQLRDVFGFDGFRPGQEEIVDAVTAGENVLAIMPTGGGKSLCFQLPALLRGGVTVVISPLIETAASRRWRRIKKICIFSATVVAIPIVLWVIDTFYIRLDRLFERIVDIVI